jgi:hypothetical protein
VLAEQVTAAIVLDTADRTVVDAARPLPDLSITRFDTVIATTIAGAAGPASTVAP